MEKKVLIMTVGERYEIDGVVLCCQRVRKGKPHIEVVWKPPEIRRIKGVKPHSSIDGSG